MNRFTSKVFAAALMMMGSFASPTLAEAQEGMAVSGRNTLRVQLGLASGNGGMYCDDYYYRRRYCGDYGPYRYQSFVLGAEYDINWRGNLYFTVGGRILAAPYYYARAFVIEPDIGLTYKFTGLKAKIEPRVAAGIGLLIGGYGGIGASLRLGGGASFFTDSKVGLAADLMFDLGGYAGYPLSTIQLTVGPEFRF
jgi:hypothetical protein